MTRVEKYRVYRNEISNMKFETFTQKREAAKQVDKFHDTDLGSKLNYEEVMIVHEIYDDKEVTKKHKFRINLTKYEIFYYLIALLFVTSMIVALIITGVNTWR